MIKFTYTKKSKEVSDRVGLVMTSPNANYGIIDISDFSTEDQETVADMYAQYCEERDEVLATLSAKYGLTNLFKNSYKNFSPDGMSNIEVI